MKYRAKPVIVDAIRLPPSGEPTVAEFDALRDFMAAHYIEWEGGGCGITVTHTIPENGIIVETTAMDGEWIVLEDDGRVRVLTDAQFQRAFESI